ncbi:mannose-specific lectin 3-like [Phoenix dactylifera]|uniref:Mannose-specific lectin 3-like n=1 Tax=Phoenix dactylifera TaxID=42345 RepID=A0A8B7BUI0_PHODC|nr:mannose-specific lectin 3-like [Phoenix dactylifera]
MAIIPSSIRQLSLLLLVLSSTVSLLAPPSTANDSNVLLTGDVLPTNGQLSNGDATFVMQGDCNLVLYNKGRGFQSGTSGLGDACTLTLDDLGQFVIMVASGSAVWSSTLRGNYTREKYASPRGNYTRGKYAAVLRPDGEVAIYGPAVWSTPNFGFSTARGAVSTQAMEVPMANNVLFSSQVLYDDAQLTTRDYIFTMRESCNLALVKRSKGIIWQTGTVDGGENCFLRLDHRGQLAVVDDEYDTVWRSQPASKDGDYVLVVQINGQAVVYGPVVWSTASYAY